MMDELYKNAQLAEVICEVRFPGNLKVDTRKDLFYDRIKSKYSNILVSNKALKGSSHLEPIQFKQKDGDNKIQLTIERISLHTYSYMGFSNFQKEFLEVFKIAAETFEIDDLKRIGYRYINVIPFIRVGGMVPLARFFNIKVEFPTDVLGFTENLNFAVQEKYGEDKLIKKLELGSGDNGQEVFLLDFDYGKYSGLRAENVAEYFRTAHDKIRSTFESLITDDFRKFLRGESV